MESYEVEVDGKTHQVKSIRSLTGHNIIPYSIHGTKAVPIVKSKDQTKMEEGDYFAIETFGSTGRGEIHDEGETSHYARNMEYTPRPLRLASAKKLLSTINREFGSIPFCRRYLDRLGEQNYLLGVSAANLRHSLTSRIGRLKVYLPPSAARTGQRGHCASVPASERCQGLHDCSIRAYHPPSPNMQRGGQQR